MPTATATASASSPSGHSGSTPLAAPNASRSPSQIARAAPMDAHTPPVVQTRPSECSTRAKRAKRTALPILAGRNALTSEPTPYRALASARVSSPPQRESAERHAHPEAASAVANERAASHSQAGLTSIRP